MAGQSYIKENTSPKQRITIKQRGAIGGKKLEVTAPLQDDFGMTVGSEFATPFDTGSINNIMSKIFYVTAISQKAGIRMKKLYAAPEPTEISFDMEFAAFYNAKDEVLLPAVTLLTMALGRRLTAEDVVARVEKYAVELAKFSGRVVDSTFGEGEISDFFKEAEDTDVDVDKKNLEISNKVLGLISVIQGPPLSEIRFGDVMVLPKCFITSAAAKFSNVLDPDGVPMSAVVSVTATLETAPIAEDIQDFFRIYEN